MDRETRWVAGLLAGLAGLGLIGSISDGGIGDARFFTAQRTWTGSPKVRQMRQCQRQREAELAANARATEAGQRQVIADLRGANVDPSRDAAEAAAAGEWGLIRTYTMMGSTPFGVDCLAADGMGHGAALVRAYRVYSDVAGSCETFGSGGDCGLERRMDAYAEAYNRTLVARADYPYRDLCRPAVAQPAAAYGHGTLDASEWGFRSLHPGPALTVHEAARRGDLAQLDRFIRSDRDLAGEPDPYGMTPLAWAVAYRQPRAAQFLVGAGAPPAGGECTIPGDPVSPVRLALRTGQDGLARWLSDRLPGGGKVEGKWSTTWMEAAAQGNSLGFLARMLAEPHARVPDPKTLRGPSSPGAVAMIREYRERLCWSAALPKNAQVRLIAVYEGPSDKRTPWPYEELPVTVVVRATAKPVVLALSSYEDTEWRLQLEPGARVAGVLALGLKTPAVRGVPKGVPVLVNDSDNGCERSPNRSYGAYRGGEQGELEELQTYVAKVLGRPVAGIQSDYAAPPTYVVG